jgi:hypothetical protein
MPLAMRRAVHQTIGNSSVFRLHLDRAHFVQTPLGGGLWLVEGNGVTCAFRARVGSSTCRTTVQARRHGLLLETYRTKGRGGAPTNFLALGIAPGWVRSALVRIAGEQQVIEVIKHGYALRAKDPIEVERLKR